MHAVRARTPAAAHAIATGIEEIGRCIKHRQKHTAQRRSLPPTPDGTPHRAQQAKKHRARKRKHTARASPPPTSAAAHALATASEEGSGRSKRSRRGAGAQLSKRRQDILKRSLWLSIKYLRRWKKEPPNSSSSSSDENELTVPACEARKLDHMSDGVSTAESESEECWVVRQTALDDTSTDDTQSMDASDIDIATSSALLRAIEREGAAYDHLQRVTCKTAVEKEDARRHDNIRKRSQCALRERDQHECALFRAGCQTLFHDATRNLAPTMTPGKCNVTEVILRRDLCDVLEFMRRRVCFKFMERRHERKVETRRRIRFECMERRLERLVEAQRPRYIPCNPHC